MNILQRKCVISADQLCKVVYRWGSSVSVRGLVLPLAWRGGRPVWPKLAKVVATMDEVTANGTWIVGNPAQPWLYGRNYASYILSGKWKVNGAEELPLYLTDVDTNGMTIVEDGEVDALEATRYLIAAVQISQVAYLTFEGEVREGASTPVPQGAFDYLSSVAVWHPKRPILLQRWNAGDQAFTGEQYITGNYGQPVGAELSVVINSEDEVMQLEGPAPLLHRWVGCLPGSVVGETPSEVADFRAAPSLWATRYARSVAVVCEESGVTEPTVPAAPEPYELPVASSDDLGGVKVGSGLAIDGGSGVLSVAEPRTCTLRLRIESSVEQYSLDGVTWADAPAIGAQVSVGVSMGDFDIIDVVSMPGDFVGSLNRISPHLVIIGGQLTGKARSYDSPRSLDEDICMWDGNAKSLTIAVERGDLVIRAEQI